MKPTDVWKGGAVDGVRIMKALTLKYRIYAFGVMNDYYFFSAQGISDTDGVEKIVRKCQCWTDHWPRWFAASKLFWSKIGLIAEWQNKKTLSLVTWLGGDPPRILQKLTSCLIEWTKRLHYNWLKDTLILQTILLLLLLLIISKCNSSTPAELRPDNHCNQPVTRTLLYESSGWLYTKTKTDYYASDQSSGLFKTWKMNILLGNTPDLTQAYFYKE